MFYNFSCLLHIVIHHLTCIYLWKKILDQYDTMTLFVLFFQMVQATIVLEDMIKTEYLRNGWQYWSPSCAAARIATISSLALRICTLDAALVYEKPLPSTSSTETEKLDSESDIYSLTCSDPTNTPKTNCKLVQKTCSLDLTESGNGNSKPSKRRKVSGG